MQALIAIIGSFLAQFVGRLASFFLSGGVVVFTAIASLVGLVAAVVAKFDEFSEVVCSVLDRVSQTIAHLEDFGFLVSDFAKSIVYSFGVDTLLSYVSTYVLVLGGIVLFVFLGLFIAVFSVVVPLVVFRVVYWIKSQFFST